MEIKYHKNFRKSYLKRIAPNKGLERRFAQRLDLFLKSPQSPPLQDHTLKGNLENLRAFSATGDIRVVYVRKGNTVYLLDIGTHNQVY